MTTKRELEQTFKQVTKFSKSHERIILQHSLPLPLTMRSTIELTDSSPCTITATIDGDITHEFTVNVTVADFARLLRAMPNNDDILDISMRTGSTERFEIRQGNRVYTISCQMEGKIKHPLIVGKYQLYFDEAQKAIQEVLPAVGHDHSRPILSYIYCTGDRMVAADGYILTVTDYLTPGCFELLLPYEVATIIADMPSTTNHLLVRNESDCGIVVGKLTFQFDKPLHKYPDFSTVIPSSGITHPVGFFVDAKDLTKELKLAMKVNSDRVTFVLDKDSSAVVVEASDSLGMTTAANLPIEISSCPDEPVDVCYNPHHVLAGLKAAGSKRVYIQIDRDNKLFITPQALFYPLTIIMPIYRSK